MHNSRDSILGKGVIFRRRLAIPIGLVAELEQTFRILQPLNVSAGKVLWVTSRR